VTKVISPPLVVGRDLGGGARYRPYPLDFKKEEKCYVKKKNFTDSYQ
jgi:hypothetical protein